MADPPLQERLVHPHPGEGLDDIDLAPAGTGRQEVDLVPAQPLEPADAGHPRLDLAAAAPGA
jgi:hypothetical protein